MKGMSPGGSEFDRALSDFQAENPTYSQTAILGSLRAWDYPHLDEQALVYLDYAGSGLYASSQIRAHLAWLQERALSEHRARPPATPALLEDIEEARASVLSFFNAPPDDYAVVFTPNAGRAIELVGEAYACAAGSRYLFSADSHPAAGRAGHLFQARGGTAGYVPLTTPELQMNLSALEHHLNAANPEANNLFAFAAQSSFSGLQYPLELIEQAQGLGWDVLLDATAYVPTNLLDLSRWKPDLVTISFPKLFGYPPGLGCLIVHKKARARLQASLSLSGSLTWRPAMTGGRRNGSAEPALEDSSLNYFNIPAVTTGLDHIQQIGLGVIQQRVAILTGWLLEQLTALRHDSGRPLLNLLGPADMHNRGGTLTMSFSDPAGELLDAVRVEQRAGEANIVVRTGWFGGGRRAGHNCRPAPDYPDAIPVTRISLGLVSNFADVYRFLALATAFLNQPAGTM